MAAEPDRSLRAGSTGKRGIAARRPRPIAPTLIRRVSLDLIGLPPTPAEVDAFVNDQCPDAYERLVDRLLASPHYGERQARPWLDQARYADTNGYEKDGGRSIWPYRDWVIRAFNRDLPFDQFTIEQIAGDLLPNATTDQRIATGFHRNTMVNTEGGIDDEEFRVAAVVDRVNTTMQVWMGTHARLRPVPRPQVRPVHAEGVFPALRVLQQHRRRRRQYRARARPPHARTGREAGADPRRADAVASPARPGDQGQRQTTRREDSEADPGQDRRLEEAGGGDQAGHDDGDAGASPAPSDARPDPRQPQRQGRAGFPRRAQGPAPAVRRISRPIAWAWRGGWSIRATRWWAG